MRVKDIEVVKKTKNTYEDRWASVMEGREGRAKFGSSRGTNKGGGSTNKNKLKNKAFGMIKQARHVKLKKMRGKGDKIVRQRVDDCGVVCCGFSFEWFVRTETDVCVSRWIARR